jgi:hypothetical protein
VSAARRRLRWTSTCTGCGRERELQTRLTHACRALCDGCAARPHRLPSAAGFEATVVPTRGNGKAPDPQSLAGIARALAAEGLRPIIDQDMGLVRAECPDCNAGAADPLGLSRPVEVVPRRDRTYVQCHVCGGSSDA